MNQPFNNNKSNTIRKWGDHSNDTNPNDQWADAVIASSLQILQTLRAQRTNWAPTRSLSLREPNNGRRSGYRNKTSRDDTAVSNLESVETWMKYGLAIGAGALAITALICNTIEDGQNNQENEED